MYGGDETDNKQETINTPVTLPSTSQISDGSDTKQVTLLDTPQVSDESWTPVTKKTRTKKPNVSIESDEILSINYIKNIMNPFLSDLKRSYSSLVSVFLYGSYARGNPKPTSDLDIIFVFKSHDFPASTDMTDAFNQIIQAISNALRKKLDVVVAVITDKPNHHIDFMNNVRESKIHLFGNPDATILEIITQERGVKINPRN